MNAAGIERIVVATDFSAGSDAAMEKAFGLAKALEATIDLVHVLDTAILAAPAPLGSLPLIDPRTLMDEIDAGLASRVEKGRQQGLVCQSSSLDGYPAREIVRHAEKTEADLIVIGTHGRTGFARVVMGSVAQRVLHRAACPVLVIPPMHGRSAR